MNQPVVIIKKGKKTITEFFDREKLYNSIVFSCLSVRVPDGQAEAIASTVCSEVIIWLKNHPEVTSQDIRIITAKNFKRHHPEAAYLYEQQHIII